MEYTKKKIIFTLPLRRIENDLFLMDLGYVVRIEAAVRFIVFQKSVTQSHKRFYPFFIPRSVIVISLPVMEYRTLARTSVKMTIPISLMTNK